MGRRFGGNKQLAPLGPSGELLSDYTLYDAVHAGAARAIFVIRPDLDIALRTHHRPWTYRADIRYAVQPVPRGTTDALLAARDEAAGSLVVVNADDFYGRAAIRAAAAWAERPDQDEVPAAAVIAWPLGDTLSPRGGVSRAVLEVDAGDWLERVEERRGVTAESGLSPDLPISMNCWVVPQAALELLAEETTRFERQARGTRDRELAIPDAVGQLVGRGKLRVRMLRAGSGWIGVTHAADVPEARAALQSLIDRGEYPSPLI
jgi:dTDP-glucose pyrophosphorylase